MKPILKRPTYILIIVIIVFFSCSKEPVNKTYYSNPSSQQPTQQTQLPLPPFPPIQDSLSGKEFLYTNLTWETWGVPYVQIEIPGSHLFLNRGILISIDSSATWINVPFYTVEFGLSALPYPFNNGYIYDNSYFDSVFLFGIHPNNSQLVGTRVSVKIKVL